MTTKNKGTIRTFTTGANRDTSKGKLDYEGFLSPTVLKRYAEYMDKNTHLSNGDIRTSDNWQKGIPFDVYMKSMFRHFMEVWSLHRRHMMEPFMPEDGNNRNEALCALMFNVMGYLHEFLKETE